MTKRSKFALKYLDHPIARDLFWFMVLSAKFEVYLIERLKK